MSELFIERDLFPKGAKVHIFKPQIGDNGNYICSYKIFGIKEIKENVYSVAGIDGLQAFLGALKVIEATIEGTDEYKAGKIKRFYDSDTSYGLLKE